MSKRAEEKSIAYQLATHGPKIIGGSAILSDDEYNRWNINYDFKNGYEEAEKDLALTWQDIKAIVNIADDLLPDPRYKQDLDASLQSEEAYYKEVLKRFKEEKHGV